MSCLICGEVKPFKITYRDRETQKELAGICYACVRKATAPMADQTWQKIETAPRDGTPILGCRLTWTHPYVFSYLDGPGLLKGWHDFNISPTGRRPHALEYWMPLPEVPKPADVS